MALATFSVKSHGKNLLIQGGACRAHLAQLTARHTKQNSRSGMGGKGSKPKTKSSNNLGSTKSSKTSAKKGCLPGKKPKPIALPPSRPVADLPAPSLELGGRRFTHGVSGWIEGTSMQYE